jgi:hypothetical protein
VSCHAVVIIIVVAVMTPAPASFSGMSGGYGGSGPTYHSSAPSSSPVVHVDEFRPLHSAANGTFSSSSAGFPAGGPYAQQIHDACRDNPHWHVFLCSSLITFFVGLLLVLIWRIVAWLVCQSYVIGGGAPGARGQRSADRRYVASPAGGPSSIVRSVSGSAAIAAPGSAQSALMAAPLPSSSNQRRHNGPPMRRFGSGGESSDNDVGWMTEAKDWAGELISGQTTTGRILVSNRLEAVMCDGVCMCVCVCACVCLLARAREYFYARSSFSCDSICFLGVGLL